VPRARPGALSVHHAAARRRPCSPSPCRRWRCSPPTARSQIRESCGSYAAGAERSPVPVASGDGPAAGWAPAGCPLPPGRIVNHEIAGTAVIAWPGGCGRCLVAGRRAGAKCDPLSTYSLPTRCGQFMCCRCWLARAYRPVLDVWLCWYLLSSYDGFDAGRELRRAPGIAGSRIAAARARARKSTDVPV
jgi:hypothetical protein